MKLSQIFLFLLLTSCTKPQNEFGSWSLYNSTGVKIEVTTHDVTFYKQDSIVIVNYTGSLFTNPFTLPANIWGNPTEVTGHWRFYGDFLEFYYQLPNDPNTYEIDFFRN